MSSKGVSASVLAPALENGTGSHKATDAKPQIAVADTEDGVVTIQSNIDDAARTLRDIVNVQLQVIRASGMSAVAEQQYLLQEAFTKGFVKVPSKRYPAEPLFTYEVRSLTRNRRPLRKATRASTP